MITSKTVNIHIDDIKVPKNFKNTFPRTSKVTDRIEFYRKNGCFDRELIIDQNNNLIDGYTVYLVCKMFGIETIRAIKLTVVEKQSNAKVAKLRELVEKAAMFTLPSNTEEFHLDMFTDCLSAYGVTVGKTTEVACRWIPTAKQPPTAEDADKWGSVMTFNGTQRAFRNWERVATNPELFTHWMSIPYAPEV